MNTKELKIEACAKIDEYRDDILKVVKKIYDSPEIGYKEQKTTEIIKKEFKKLNLETQNNISITGLKAQAKGNTSKPHLAILGELDAVKCKEHPDSDSNTGAIHACGHNNQIGIMLGVAYALIKTNIIKELNGIIDFLAVPAEEYIDLEYKEYLREQGEIKYFGGKQELISRGYFDDIDLAIMAHSIDLGEMKDVIVAPQSEGFIRKKVKFIGYENLSEKIFEQEINALDAAVFAINGLSTDKGTNIDKDNTRIYINNEELLKTSGSVIMETYIRGTTVQELINSNKRVNNRIKEATKNIEARAEINDTPGYFPLLNYEGLMEILVDNLDGIISKEKVIKNFKLEGFFDTGDLSHIIPVLHPFFSGVKGSLHSDIFKTTDYEKAVINPAKVLTRTVIDILSDRQNKLKKLNSPPYNKKEYLSFLEEISS
ncbi:MAG: M20/M25/M40 family metallo-hydrolase [Halanaerobiales bacterium]|nr:M20/M25/M40 family metallo-hydrolase [Halanaerobiales bacterium]